MVFLGPHLWHMEVSRLGVESEVQLPAYNTATATPVKATSAMHQMWDTVPGYIFQIKNTKCSHISVHELNYQ